MEGEKKETEIEMLVERDGSGKKKRRKACRNENVDIFDEKRRREKNEN